MNLIIKNTEQIKFFTYLPQIFDALKIACREFDWYLSDIETNGFDIKDGWYTGEELSQRIEENEIQFIWGVISAVKKRNRPIVADSPYADGNSDLWNIPNIKPQLPEALFEIVSWDSSATILIGLNDELTEKFTSVYSDAKKLTNIPPQ